ncbi:MAG: DUF934 domain-containing protein [Burkholderiales bacterium]|nr:DUF934 domain-containing protein [Burkholderiales bacterium]
MPVLIKDAQDRQRRIVSDDTWRVIGLPEDAAAHFTDDEDVIVPLPAWRSDAVALRHRTGRTGVWLGPADEPADLAGASAFPVLVAVHFPSFTDGRGYSTARLLRERYGYRGELRAIGDILRAQLYELARCGFDAFVLREDQDAQAALRAFGDFSEDYQAAVDRGPLFARRFGALGQPR